jgi:23S rRNA (guanosine2251-2'-O)-methyltransferase
MQLTYGINPLVEGLLSHPSVFEKILIARGRGKAGLQKILSLAEENGIPVEYIDREKIDKLAQHGVHQGILGFCRERDYATVEDVIANRRERNKYDLVVILDGVADPRNLGSIIRTAYCLGANGIIIPENRAASITALTSKASAGASELLPVAKVVNIVRTMEYLKKEGFWIYGTDADGGLAVHSLDYEGNIAVVAGSEGHGIRPLVRKNCDFLISIPMMGRVASLNVSVATGVILFEILRKWGEGA